MIAVKDWRFLFCPFFVLQFIVLFLGGAVIVFWLDRLEIVQSDT